jgi:metallophosphoesterase (TIGR00282 family)
MCNAAMLNILFLGDIVGQPGRDAVIALLPKLKSAHSIDFAIVNGENSANGRGITRGIGIDLLRAGAAVITTGDHVWDQKETEDYILTEPRLLRPCNFPDGAPGEGSIILETKKGKVGVINVCGRTFMNVVLDDPFRRLHEEVLKMRQETPVIFVDAHAETTSEKIALARYMDGRVSAVVGTHTHVQTGDERLCDAGMCGPRESILGREIEAVLHKFTTGMPSRLHIAKGDVLVCGCVVSVDEETGHAISIRRIQELWKGN